MRIRSIKPEFWASEDVAALDWPTRLLFIGLWSYVDDNGVGRDVEKLIMADLFPLEDDPRETLATVSRGLQTLSAASLITRYTVDGRPFLHVTTWDKHQRIDRPGKARYPLPTCTDTTPRDTLASVSRQSRDSLDAGEGEKGRRGEGDTATRREVAKADSTDAQTLVGEWIDNQKDRPPARVIGQVSRELKAMLDEGIPYRDVRNGLIAWHTKGLHPSTLASVVHETRTARSRPAQAPQPRMATTDRKLLETQALVEELRAAETRPAPLALPGGAA